MKKYFIIVLSALMLGVLALPAGAETLPQVMPQATTNSLAKSDAYTVTNAAYARHYRVGPRYYRHVAHYYYVVPHHHYYQRGVTFYYGGGHGFRHWHHW